MDLKSEFIFNTEFAKNTRFVIDIHTSLEAVDRWLLLSDLYDVWLKNKKHPDNLSRKIPKIIHHIWLGSPIPKKYTKFINTWKAKNPDWEFILWDDKKLDDFEMINKTLYRGLKNFGAKSDVARLEILYKIGGFYLDTDFECLKSIDEKLLINDFIAGVGFNSFPELLNSFMAAKPFSNFIMICLRELKNKNIKKNILSHEIIRDTGPFFLTRNFFSYLKNKNIDNEVMLILPTNFYFPLPNYVRNIPLHEVYTYKTNESIGLHHWDTSWNKISILDYLKLLIKKFK